MRTIDFLPDPNPPRLSDRAFSWCVRIALAATLGLLILATIPGCQSAEAGLLREVRRAGFNLNHEAVGAVELAASLARKVEPAEEREKLLASLEERLRNITKVNDAFELAVDVAEGKQ
jgi:hypothetical protein